ncbi:hypothetical protein BJY52DRAFT_1300097 [Lactarius psammicola]|nr:hypothetical protein BJY52DRAFT_1300097 [Lactarius psammicola]
MFFDEARALNRPIVRLERKFCVFPGIPGLFHKMPDGLKGFLPPPPSSERPFRLQIFTSCTSNFLSSFVGVYYGLY